MSEVSGKWKLNLTDVKRWLMNTLIFVQPAVIIYLVSVQAAFDDGFAWSDFAINQIVLGAIMGWAISTALDLFRKLKADPKPQA